jgi:hypothetical protein
VFAVVAFAAQGWPWLRNPLVLVSAYLLILFAVFFTLGLGLPYCGDVIASYAFSRKAVSLAMLPASNAA